MIKADFHIHTNLCDGADSPEEMVKAAIDMGFKHLGFSGHMDPENGVPMDTKKYREEIREVQKKYSGEIDILLGGEVDYYFEGDTSDLEFKIGSTHTLKMKDGSMFSVDDTEEILKKYCDEYYNGDYYALAKDYFETEVHIIEKVKPDFIGHFDLVTRFNDSMNFIDEDDPRYYKKALETLEYLSKEDIPFEINCGAVNRGRKSDFYPNRRLLKALNEFGGRIILSSDAHDKKHIGASFSEAAKTVLECGFKSTCILVHNEKGGITLKEIPLE